MKPLVIIINGKGGVGKDTICGIIRKHFCTGVYSSITPVKNIAKAIGWDGGKTDKDRKFLSDLKDALTAYNDMPMIYMENALYDAEPEIEIMIFHIREPEEIKKFKAYVESKGYKCKTLLILSIRTQQSYGNHADDDVENHTYDMVYQNDGKLEDLEEDFMEFWRKNI